LSSFNLFKIIDVEKQYINEQKTSVELRKREKRGRRDN